MHERLEVGRLAEARYQLPEVEGHCAEVGCSQSLSEGNRPTGDHVLLQLADDARLQTVTRDRSTAWREVRGLGEAQLGSPCLIVCFESDASLPQIRPESNVHHC